jgi:hypothetical protein
MMRCDNTILAMPPRSYVFAVLSSSQCASGLGGQDTAGLASFETTRHDFLFLQEMSKKRAANTSEILRAKHKSKACFCSSHSLA